MKLPAPLVNTRPGDDYRGHGVYRLLTREAVAYIGQTRNIEARMWTHANAQPWWPEVVGIEWTPVASRREALDLERDCIQRDNPLYNMAGRRQLTRAKYPLPQEATARIDELLDLDNDGVNPELDRYMRALREAGWTLAAIGTAAGMTVERARQRVLTAGEPTGADTVPAFVRPPAPSMYAPRAWPMPTEEEVAELQALQPYAKRCRNWNAPGSPERVSSERLSELLAELKLRGVRDHSVAAVLGISVGAVRQRLYRHGYMNRPPSLPPYKGEPSPLVSVLRSACVHGHEYTPENVRYINGDPTRPRCKPCEDAAGARYRARRAARQQAAA